MPVYGQRQSIRRITSIEVRVDERKSPPSIKVLIDGVSVQTYGEISMSNTLITSDFKNYFFQHGISMDSSPRSPISSINFNISGGNNDTKASLMIMGLMIDGGSSAMVMPLYSIEEGVNHKVWDDLHRFRFIGDARVSDYYDSDLQKYIDPSVHLDLWMLLKEKQ